MSTLFAKTLLEEPKLRNAGFRYGFLAAICALLISDVLIPSTHYYGSLVVPVMLLFNHLAFQFRWPRGVMVTLRIIALGWLVGGSIYIFTRQAA